MELARKSAENGTEIKVPRLAKRGKDNQIEKKKKRGGERERTKNHPAACGGGRSVGIGNGNGNQMSRRQHFSSVHPFLLFTEVEFLQFCGHCCGQWACVVIRDVYGRTTIVVCQGSEGRVVVETRDRVRRRGSIVSP